MNKTLLKKNTMIFLISAISIFWFAWLLKQGIALSPDSTSYLNYSIYIKNSLDFSHIRTVWPPAYPTLVAIGQFFVETPSGGATLISAIMLFLSLYFLNKIMEIANIELVIRAFAIVLLFLNAKYLFIFQYAWSEGPFTAFYLGAVYFLIKHNLEEKIKYLFIASIFISIVALSRYLGYSLIIMLMLYVGYYNFRKKDFISKDALIRYFLIGVSGFLSFLWILRNYSVDETFHGPRNPSPYSLLENIKLFIKITALDNKIIFIVLAVFLPLVVYMLWQICKEKDSKNLKPVFIIFTTTIVVYVLLTIYSATTARFDKLNTRFFAPIYPFVIFVFALTTARLASFVREVENKKTLTKALFGWVLFLVLFASAAAGLKYFKAKHNPSMPVGLGYNKSKLKKSILAWVEKNIEPNQQNNIFIFADYSRNQNVRISITRGLLLRTFDKRAKDYKHSGNGKNLQVSYSLDSDRYSLNYIDQQAIDEKFRDIFLDQKPLIIADQRRFDEIGEIVDLSDCAITKLHTLYGVSCNK